MDMSLKSREITQGSTASSRKNQDAPAGGVGKGEGAEMGKTLSATCDEK